MEVYGSSRIPVGLVRHGLVHHVDILDREIGKVAVFIRTGEYPNGTLAEVFLDIAREGSTLAALADAAVAAMSIGLQHGVHLSQYTDKFIHTRFAPSGAVAVHGVTQGSCTSVLDYLARWLAERYPDGRRAKEAA